MSYHWEETHFEDLFRPVLNRNHGLAGYDAADQTIVSKVQVARRAS